MAKKRPTEIFDLDTIDSVVRQILRSQGPIDLADFEIPTFSIPEDYTTVDVALKPDNYQRMIRQYIEPVVQEAEDSGFSTNIYTAIYEGVLNAFQHGNDKDPSKKVILGYSIQDDEATFTIVDEGGVIDPELAAFVLMHRKHGSDGPRQTFYEFSGRQRPETNHGTGTTFMHIYADQVRYHKHEDGGLALVLSFEREPKA